MTADLRAQIMGYKFAAGLPGRGKESYGKETARDLLVIPRAVLVCYRTSFGSPPGIGGGGGRIRPGMPALRAGYFPSYCPAFASAALALSTSFTIA